MSTIPPIEPPHAPEAGGIWQRCRYLVSGLNDLRITEKISGIAALLILVMTLLVVMSIQSVRLQAQYRHALADFGDRGDQCRARQRADLRDCDGIARHLYV